MRNSLRLLLLALLFPPGTLHAQRSAAREAGLRALKSAADSALRRLAVYDDSVRAANGRLDSLQVGPIRLLVDPSLRAIAKRAAQMALDSVKPRLGGSVERVRRYTYVMRMERFTQWWKSNKPDSNIVIETFDRSGPPLSNIRQRYDTALVAVSMRTYMPLLVFRDASPSFVGWMGGFVAVDTMSREDWRSLRFGLVSSRAAVGRRCYAGDMLSCSFALQFTPVTDTVRQWYDASDRHRIVKRTETIGLRIDGFATKRCLDGDDGSCASLLRRYPPTSLPEPMAIQTRATLVRLAVQLGGDSAVERLLQGDRAPLERLSAASRMPVDSLIRRWQASAKAIRASSRDLSPEIVLGALFWSVALGALSLRSSRWR